MSSCPKFMGKWDVMWNQKDSPIVVRLIGPVDQKGLRVKETEGRLSASMISCTSQSVKLKKGDEEITTSAIKFEYNVGSVRKELMVLMKFFTPNNPMSKSIIAVDAPSFCTSLRSATSIINGSVSTSELPKRVRTSTPDVNDSDSDVSIDSVSSSIPSEILCHPKKKKAKTVKAKNAIVFDVPTDDTDKPLALSPHDFNIKCKEHLVNKCVEIHFENLQVAAKGRRIRNINRDHMEKFVDKMKKGEYTPQNSIISVHLLPSETVDKWSPERANDYLYETLNGNHRLRALNELEDDDLRNRYRTVYANVYKDLNDYEIQRLSRHIQENSEETLSLEFFNIMRLYRHEVLDNPDVYLKTNPDGTRGFKDGMKKSIDITFSERVTHPGDFEYMAFFVFMSDEVFNEWMNVLEAYSAGKIRIRGNKMSSGRFPMSNFRQIKSKSSRTCKSASKSREVKIPDQTYISWTSKLLNDELSMDGLKAKIKDAFKVARLKSDVADNLGVDVQELSLHPHAMSKLDTLALLEKNRYLSSTTRRLLSSKAICSSVTTTSTIVDPLEISEMGDIPSTVIIGDHPENSQYETIKTQLLLKHNGNIKLIFVGCYRKFDQIVDLRHKVKQLGNVIISEPILICHEPKEQDGLVGQVIHRYVLIAHFYSGIPLATVEVPAKIFNSLDIIGQLVGGEPILVYTDEMNFLSMLVKQKVQVKMVLCSPSNRELFQLLLTPTDEPEIEDIASTPPVTDTKCTESSVIEPVTPLVAASASTKNMTPLSSTNSTTAIALSTTTPAVSQLTSSKGEASTPPPVSRATSSKEAEGRPGSIVHEVDPKCQTPNKNQQSPRSVPSALLQSIAANEVGNKVVATAKTKRIKK